LPFEVQFACHAEALRQILNALTEARWFLTVRQLAVSTESLQAAAEATSATVGEGAAARARREVLLVTLHVDLVEFAKPEPAKP